MRRQGASIFIYLIFTLLIVIFVINFAPNTGRGSGSGCGVSSNSKVTVDGTGATETAYHIAYSANQATGKEKTYIALDALIRRELLAQAAEAKGLRVTGDLVDEEIKKGYFFLGGIRIDLSRQFFDEYEDGTRTWNLRKFKGWVQSLNVSMGAYRDEQARSMEAALMGELMQSSVRVSRDEALADYLYEGNTVSYDVVEFKPGDYRAAMKLGDADIARYLAAHDADVQARYKADERTYKGTKPQAKLRQIFIEKADDAQKAKLEAARTQIAAKTKAFADAAKELSTQDAAKASGGELGWRPTENAGLGDKALNDAVKTLKAGELTPVVATAGGAYLVQVVDKREGDLSYDQVKLDIAGDLARDAYAKEAAKRAALTALADARASGKTLDQLYEKEARTPQPGGNIEEMLKNLPPEQREQLMKQPKGQMQGGGADPEGPQGKLEIDLGDEPVAWYAGPDGAGGGSGSAAAPAPAAPAAPAAALEPSKDVLPAFGDVAKPKVERVGPVPRMQKLPNVGGSKEAIAALFEELPAGGYATRVYESDEGYAVVQLAERAQPKVEEFDKNADQQIAQLREARGRTLVRDWLSAKCEALLKDGKIKPASDLITEHDDKGNVVPTTYRPCMYFSRF